MNEGKKKGSALYMVLMIMSILIILGFAISSLAISNYKMRYLSDQITKNLYIAEAGIDEAYAIISKVCDDERKKLSDTNNANISENNEDNIYSKNEKDEYGIGSQDNEVDIRANIKNAINSKVYSTSKEFKPDEYNKFDGVLIIKLDDIEEVEVDELIVKLTSICNASNIRKIVKADYHIKIEYEPELRITVQKENWAIVR